MNSKQIADKSQLDDQAKKEKAMQLLQLYVRNIGNLQKQNWSNFFTNMNCPNYDKEYFEKERT